MQLDCLVTRITKERWGDLGWWSWIFVLVFTVESVGAIRTIDWKYNSYYHNALIHIYHMRTFVSCHCSPGKKCWAWVWSVLFEKRLCKLPQCFSLTLQPSKLMHQFHTKKMTWVFIMKSAILWWSLQFTSFQPCFNYVRLYSDGLFDPVLKLKPNRLKLHIQTAWSSNCQYPIPLSTWCFQCRILATGNSPMS